MAENLSITVIAGETRLNAFMSAFDMREPGKVFAHVQRLQATFAPRNGHTLQSAMEALVEASRERYLVAYCRLMWTTPDGATESAEYVNPAVTTISDGQKWCLLSDMIQALRGG